MQEDLLPDLEKNIIEDFYLSPSNRDAYSLINGWPKWIKKTINVYGEKFSGKSHLSTIFEATTFFAMYLAA